MPKSSFFLFGVRGSGKSTWVAMQGREFHEVNLLNEALYQRILGDPRVFSGPLERLPLGSWVFVDEVQRIPALLNDVHRMIEDRKLRFVLTGSSARRLRRGGANLLAGRAMMKEIFPFVPEELGDAFSLERTLELGSLPLILAAPASQRRERLRAYAQSYLKEEIQAEALVRKLAGFVRFLPIAGLFHAQVINVSSLARDCGVERTTVANYLEVLQDTLMAFTLPGFEARLRVRERKHPKLYWTDSGIVRAAKGDVGPVQPEERGALFEGWVAQLLRAYQSYRSLYDEMYYWSPTEAKGIEVDFLLRCGKDFIAIEAKSGSRVRPDWTRGLNAISELPRVRRKIVVHGGPESFNLPDRIEALSASDFCKELRLGRLA